jgi:hypothetical protein
MDVQLRAGELVSDSAADDTAILLNAAQGPHTRNGKGILGASRSDDAYGKPCVVLLAVVVEERSTKTAPPQARNCGQSLFDRQVPVESAVGRSAQQVIHREPRAEEWPGPRAAVHGEQKWLEPNQVGRKPQQYRAFAKRLAHETDLELLEIAEAAVDEARRATASPDRNVVALDQCGAKPSTRSVQYNPASGDPAAHDEDVPTLTSKRIEIPSAGI